MRELRVVRLAELLACADEGQQAAEVESGSRFERSGLVDQAATCVGSRP